MTEEFAGRDLSGARFDGVDLAGARFHNVNMSGVVIREGMLANAKITGMVAGLTVNGFEVWPLIEKELLERHPERAKLRGQTPDAVREAWGIIEELWESTLARAAQLDGAALHERVDDEWSFLETLRHMIFVIDGWISRVVHRRSGHYYRYAMPPSFIPDVGHLDIDVAGDPASDEVIGAWRERMGVVRTLVDDITPDDLTRVCATNEARGYPPTTEHTVLRCLQTTLDEAWWHNFYANRDLTSLGAAE